MWSRATNPHATVMQKMEIARKPLRSGLFGGHCGGCTSSNMAWPQRKLYRRHAFAVAAASGAESETRIGPRTRPQQPGKQRLTRRSWRRRVEPATLKPRSGGKGKTGPVGHQPELRPLAMKSNRRNFLEASGALLTSAVLSGTSIRQGAPSQEL